MKDNYKGKKTNIPYVDVPGEVEAAPDGLYPWLKGLSLLPRTAEFNIERPSIDFISERANYGSVTQTKAVTFTFDLRNAKPLSSAYIRFTANGDAVSFSNFAQMNGSLDFNAGVGELNIIFFFYDGTTAWYYIPHGTAPTGGGGGSVTANHGNVAYVATGGNDGTGVVGNISKPFLTADGAIAALTTASGTDDATVVILSSSATIEITDYDYTTMPYNLDFHVLCPSDVSLEGSCSFGLLRLKTQGAVYANTSLICATDDSWDIECSTFVVPATANGSIEVSGTIKCNIFIVYENANASIILDVIEWRKSATVGVINSFNYNKCTPKRWVGIISQDGTSAPSIDREQENTLGVINTGYSSVGIFTLNAPDFLFQGNATVFFMGQNSNAAGLSHIMAEANNSETLTIYSYNASNVLANSKISSMSITIEVYFEKY